MGKAMSELHPEIKQLIIDSLNLSKDFLLIHRGLLLHQRWDSTNWAKAATEAK